MGERVVWADGICVNQQDAVEKSHQIAMMHRIYEEATCATVYLGQGTQQSDEGMRILRSITTMKTSQDISHGDVLPKFQKDTDTIVLSDNEDSIGDVLRRPWFERMWTVQEAILARKLRLVCGTAEVSWRTTFNYVRFIVYRIKSLAISPFHAGYTIDWSPLLVIVEAQMRQAAKKEGISLHRNQLDLMYDFRGRKATDPRDKYFAVLNIIEDADLAVKNVVTDYSISVREIHRKFVSEIDEIDRGQESRRFAALEFEDLVSRMMLEVTDDMQDQVHNRSRGAHIKPPPPPVPVKPGARPTSKKAVRHEQMAELTEIMADLSAQQQTMTNVYNTMMADADNPARTIQ